MISETGDILYRYSSKQDLSRLSQLISSSPEAMPLLFHYLDNRTQHRILVLRYMFEKYLDRLRRFAISLSPITLFTGAHDRTAIVAVEKMTSKVIGAVLLSSLLDMWSLDIIVVNKAYRNKGIGTRLVELAKEHARIRGACKIVTTTGSNSASAHFFRDRGFEMRYRLEQMECEL